MTKGGRRAVEPLHAVIFGVLTLVLGWWFLNGLESGRIADLAGDPSTSIHRDLVPLPLAPTDELPRTVLVSLGDEPDELERALTALRAEGTPAQVAAATIEQVGGRTVGRARLLLPEGTDRARAEQQLRDSGVSVEEVTL